MSEYSFPVSLILPSFKSQARLYDVSWAYFAIFWTVDKERWCKEGLSRWMIFASANGLLTIYLLKKKSNLICSQGPGCFKIARAIRILT